MNAILSEYETGVLFGTLSLEQWNNLPQSLKDKLDISKLKETP